MRANSDDSEDICPPPWAQKPLGSIEFGSEDGSSDGLLQVQGKPLNENLPQSAGSSSSSSSSSEAVVSGKRGKVSSNKAKAPGRRFRLPRVSIEGMDKKAQDRDASTSEEEFV